MADCRITCIRKPNRNSSCEHITHIGNPPTWVWTREAVIKSIEERINSFYVIDPETGARANVGIRRPNDGRSPFLQTYADKKWNNNLLSLDECPLNMRADN